MGQDRCIGITNNRPDTFVAAINPWIADPPELLIVAAGILTQLGDLWFVLGLFSILYWFGNERELLEPRDNATGAALLGLALATFGAVMLLKAVFAAPRPPTVGTTPELVSGVIEPIWMAATGVDSPSFPSGHAALATASYVALARHLDRFRPVTRWALAVAGIIIVGWTRIALGVHYPLDVIAGGALGLGLVVLAEVVLAERPLALYGLAILVGLAAVLLGTGQDAFWLVGMALGGASGWAVVRDITARPPAPVAIATLALVAVIGGVGYAVVESSWLALGFGGVAGASILGLPGLLAGSS